MNYGNIKDHDIADGEGVRVTLFVSGCRHHCEGCFQPQTWNFDYGEPYTEEVEEKLLRMLDSPIIAGFTCLGGEPFEPENQRVLVGLFRKIRERFPEKTIWCYTGYTYETDLLEGGSVHTEVTDEMLRCIDVLVDGEFVLALKNLALKFRGSSNQRLLHLKDGKIVSVE